MRLQKLPALEKVLPPDPDADRPKPIREASEDEMKLKAKQWAFDVAHYDHQQRASAARTPKP